MDADLDTFVTALYVKIDDALRMRPELRQWRPRWDWSQISTPSC